VLLRPLAEIGIEKYDLSCGRFRGREDERDGNVLTAYNKHLGGK
jgi:hypothetical protein